jgi:ferric-dicitrate binding protein FerR (iron transport regulator)
MNDDYQGGDDATADRDIEALLCAAGPRLEPPAEIGAAVQAAVAAEWHAVVAARRPARRRVAPWLAVASVAAVAVGAWFVAPRLLSPAADFATVARLAGPVDVRHAADGSWAPLAASAALRAGDELRTSPEGRVALRRADGLEIRLDAETTVALAAAEAARLDQGRVYVDAGHAGASADAFEVETAFGNVRHLGTQYSVGLASGGLEVAVREGSVAVEHGHDPVVARAGERLSVAADGRVRREAVATHGDAWAWAQSVAPAFAIEGRTLDEFLAWAARETGRQLVYASADAAREAEQTELKGSVAGLAPEAAVAAVLTTTPTLQHRFADAQLRIERAPR